MNTGRQLELWLGRQRIGRLDEQGSVWAFEYDRAWQVEGFDLSPQLPRQESPHVDGASDRPVQWFFDNLLPEDAARDVLAAELSLASADAFGLLTALGAESAGAWTLRPPGAEGPESGLVPLPFAVLSRRIAAMPRFSLQHDAPKRMSLAGAQHKLAIVVDGDSWFEPRGDSASTHILKPDHPQVEHWPHSAFNESLCMRLAEAAGLNAPATSFHRVPQPVYLVQRFDRRRGADGQVERLPVIDACQLLGVDRSYKYRLSTPETLREVAARCAKPAATRLALLRWTIFNLLIGNGDAHLKNLSFLIGTAGVELAPFYDLLSTAIYRQHPSFDRPNWAAAEVSLPHGELRRFGDLNRERLTELARALAIAPAAAQRESGRMIERLRMAFLQLEAQWQAAPMDRAPDGGEWRLFRSLGAGLFTEQARRLAR
ncbi:MAG TPA: HipA domain-containing protein [Chiayiivirga sp.]|nr:MAG: type II toxin-antitoxin system HipA family toxin [Gammaproteobacteria bacterium]HPA01620.1 HipA domain-containing protein [Chiayiivirga sp.]